MAEFENLNEEQKMKAENDFLKMKIMLEHGSEFHSGNNEQDLPAKVENDFLKHIIEFEKQFDERKTITIFEKIKRPQQFRPVNEIGEDAMEQAWENLLDYMQQYGVDLSACSPKVTARELYRFTTEELFKHEMDDMNMPGWTSGFIYDEFYPDHEYENTNTAVDDCIKPIFNKKPFEWMTYFRKENIRLNDHYPLSEDEYKSIINRFKDSFDEIDLNDINDLNCTINDKTCRVSGFFSANGKLSNETLRWDSKWQVDFEVDEDIGYWYIMNVQIESIDF